MREGREGLAEAVDVGGDETGAEAGEGGDREVSWEAAALGEGE